MNHDPTNTALVVGGGFAGMQAALILAERGHGVILVERRPAIGGLFALLDTQFPTQSCGLCFMACASPTYCPFVQCELHENVEVVSYARVGRVEGQAGAFRVHLTQELSGVDPEKCTDCGECEAVCPVRVPWEFGDGIETRKAIYKYYCNVVGKSYVVDRTACTRCGKCVEACGPGAVDLDGGRRELEVEAACVILAPGAEVFPATRKEEFGCGRYANVISAVRFERMLSKEGPTSGRLARPSDGATPRSLGFIQCVGSRDFEIGQGHCSSVCCMTTLKQALLARKRHPGPDIAVYYMDMRTVGKGYEAYLRRAEAAGVRFVRAIPSVVRQVPGSYDLILEVADDDMGRREDTHGMVVLATGLCVEEEARRLAHLFAVEFGEDGFVGATEFSPCETNVPGVFACGSFSGPKDIPETTVQASCAAALAAKVLAAPAEPEEPDMPTPVDFRGEPPQIGVILCTCEGFNEERADFGCLADAVRNVPGVSFVETVGHACSKQGMAEARWLFAEREPNRLVLGACSHRIVETLYGYMLRRIGVHPGILEVANLREACLEAGGGEPAARELLLQAVRRAWYAGFAPCAREQVERTVLVIGGGATGMRSALDLAGLGHPVHLIERKSELGGNLRTAHFTLKGGDAQSFLIALESRVRCHPDIRVHTGARITAVEGRLGDFRTELETAEGSVEILHGGVVLATGASEAKTRSYGYGRDSRVVTQRELETCLAAGGFQGKRVVMIQCVESREEAENCRSWCSRVCCTHAVKNALKILEAHPDAEVTILYRDLRTYGTYEHFYREAREKGVLFVPYDLDHRPEVVTSEGELSVAFLEPALGRELTVEPDWLVLSVGMAPDAEENRRLAELYGVEVDADGFFVEKSHKAATTDFARQGIYMAGLCHAPKHIDESLAQAGAAAGRCSAILARGVRRVSERVSYVVEKLCSRCGVCVEVCPSGARSLEMNRNLAVVDALLCQACGVCVAACANKAAQQYGSASRQVLLAMEEVL